MNRRDYAFGKPNYILLLAGLAIIIVGFLLMTGSSTTEDHFESDIFSTRRTVIAPLVCLIGFISIIVAIMWRPFKKSKDLNDQKELLKVKETEETVQHLTWEQTKQRKAQSK